MPCKSILFLTFFVIASSQQMYSVDYHNGAYKLRQGEKTSDTLAWGYYAHDVFKDGWGKLYLWTSKEHKIKEQTLQSYFAAGYLEAALTYEPIYNHYWSWYDYFFAGKGISENAKKFLLKQDQFTRMLIEENPHVPYYDALARVTAQNDGIFAGIQDFAGDYKISYIDLLILQASGDLLEIVPAADQENQINWDKIHGKEKEDTFKKLLSCSVLIKAKDDWSEVFTGHTLFNSYQNMLRIYKYIDFGGADPYKISYAGSAGKIFSQDDYYLISERKLVVMETTIGNLNNDLYQLVVPYSLLTWQRATIANALAQNGQEWTSIYQKHNSGTFNNQYIVVDYKQFVPGSVPKKDFVWISETMPGMVRSMDVTQIMIEQGNYWSSYNVPYIKDIYNYAGYQKAYEKEGDFYSYENTPRAKIFRRDHQKVQSLDDYKRMIRYNDYQNDDLSKNNPCYAIACRTDLDNQKPETYGSIDGKVTTYELVQENKSWAQCSPSYDSQPVFDWNNFDGVHLGQPDRWEFPWILLTEPQ